MTHEGTKTLSCRPVTLSNNIISLPNIPIGGMTIANHYVTVRLYTIITKNIKYYKIHSQLNLTRSS